MENKMTQINDFKITPACIHIRTGNGRKSINNRGRTYSTHHEVLVLVLGVETEPNLVVVL